ncbi:MAG TPA: ornithine cyclodeaminase, partial [Porphyromonadaceae bacterium]|nr:ornithine cyclodeaminase [Porphyromonadaceae bacterium]
MTMKIISQQRIKSLAISPKRCVEWIGESFAMKAQAQLPAKISVHPADTDFFTSMPCLLPNPADTGVNFHRQYFGVKEVHRIEGAVPSLGSDLMLYDAKSGELLALMDSDWITTMRTGAVAAVSAKALRKTGAETYAFVGLGNTARASLLCILEAEPEKHFKVKL